MHNTRMKYLSFFLLLLCINLGALAHAGGHGDTEGLRTWTNKNGHDLANGSFLYLKGERLFIEADDHKVLGLDLAQLSDEDLKFINQKVQSIAIINGQDVHQVKIREWNFYSFLEVIVYLILLGLVFYGGFKFFDSSNSKFEKGISSLFTFALVLLLLTACSKASEDVVTTTTLSTVDASDPAYMSDAFSGFANVSTSYDNNTFYIESNGFPEYSDMMVGIIAWIDQVPIPQYFDKNGIGAWELPLNPELSDSSISIQGHFQKGAIGIAVNGIPIFNPINASGLISAQIGELDAYGGHSGRGDDYHYHIAPLHLEAKQGLKPIAYVLDGFPVYGSTEPDGSAMAALDAYHGHEWEGGYHYHGTNDYPYMVGSIRGKINTSGTAPEDQISPQPVSPMLRTSLHPMTNNSGTTLITGCTPNGNGNGYKVSYTFNGQQGSVEYSWDENELYTFIFHDIDGTTTTETYQR